MSHREQLNFVSKIKKYYPTFFVNKKILEVGSLNINGTIRIFFDDCDYLGLDILPGKDVDIVSLGHEYKCEDETFDVVISCECFEHNPYWEKTFANMIRMCKKDGLILFTCATTGRKEHGTIANDPNSSPLTVAKNWNYYKNLTENDFKKNFNFNEIFKDYDFITNDVVFDLYFYGFKK